MARLSFIIAVALLTQAGACEAPSESAIPPPPERCPSPGLGVEVGGEMGTGTDFAVNPQRRLVLMGGGPEDDDASRAFVAAANGGDVVVLRASGSLTSYPDYFARDLGVVPPPGSVVTVRTSTPSAGGDAAALCWLRGAEAVWMAGGNQWDYLGRWPSSLHMTLAELTSSGVAVGGTSAGAVSLGEAAFDAESGTVTSGSALQDPLQSDISLTYPVFAQPELDGVLVDSHFTARDREGRLLAFLARFLVERSRLSVVGVGLDEGVALSIQDGGFEVAGNGTGSAWFYRLDAPVQLTPGSPLDLPSVQRVRLAAGTTGSWPLDFDAAGAGTITVVDGAVR